MPPLTFRSRSFAALAAGTTLALTVGTTAAATGVALQVQVQGDAGQPLTDAVLLLEPKGGFKGPLKPAPLAEVAQQGRRFEPMVTVVPVGTKVQFPNHDSVRHHLYSFSPAKKFELKLYVGRPESPIEFDRPGLVVLGCNIHDAMIGWVVVTDTPWFAKTGSNGHATLADVPPGQYTLRSWHPDLPAASTGVEQPVTVGSAGLELVARVPVAGR